jgi:hypothetical protein
MQTVTEKIGIGFQTYGSDGGEEFGAVREIADRTGELVIYVGNAGDFTVPVRCGGIGSFG